MPLSIWRWAIITCRSSSSSWYLSSLSEFFRCYCFLEHKKKNFDPDHLVHIFEEKFQFGRFFFWTNVLGTFFGNVSEMTFWHHYNVLYGPLTLSGCWLMAIDLNAVNKNHDRKLNIFCLIWQTSTVMSDELKKGSTSQQKSVSHGKKSHYSKSTDITINFGTSINTII